ncbi:hypothetical protein AJ79_00445 [Helicocarpus griseus UAMH5409]|uniref:LysM domain-containing protein n=1 Tax=Helicocarpus griseus UAMH5409 TaxID=1447875 RepID=A0A2B7YBV0_9EURO|nr:hypothetical protein AJ79_00445 [Helicocarpus griseus UAMH5409]
MANHGYGYDTATYLTDHFLYTYNLSCRKDSTFGRSCDEIFVSSLGSDPALSQNCSDCMLGVVQLQLNSPFGYQPEFAEDFQSITSSCGAGGYDFTSPTPYSISTNPTPAPEAPTCLKPYIVQPGDSCDAIALSQNVSTYSIIISGSLDFECTRLQAGASLCLPSPCTLYRMRHDETCESILARHNSLTEIDMINWNPNIDPLCSNLGPLAETLICVSPPGGDPVNVTPITEPPSTPTMDYNTPLPEPTNGKEESNLPCAK